MQQFLGIPSDFPGVIHPDEALCGFLSPTNLAGKQASRGTYEGYKLQVKVVFQGSVVGWLVGCVKYKCTTSIDKYIGDIGLDTGDHTFFSFFFQQFYLF